MLRVGDLKATEGPPAIIYVAAGRYLFGGTLILLGRRWLWILGAIINALVISFFVSAYSGGRRCYSRQVAWCPRRHNCPRDQPALPNHR